MIKKEMNLAIEIYNYINYIGIIVYLICTKKFVECVHKQRKHQSGL